MLCEADAPSHSDSGPAPVPREVILKLRGRSNLAGFLTIAVDWGIIVGAAWASVYFASIWVYLISVVVISRQMNALFELHHHAMHGNLFRRKRLNEALECFYSLPLFLRVADDRADHMEHHRNFSAEAGDHLSWGSGYGFDLSRRGSRGYMIWFLLVRPFLGPLQFEAVVSLVKSKTWRRATGLPVVGFWAIVAGGFALAGRLDLLLWYWLVPYFTLYPVLFFWEDMMGHYNCPKTGTRELRGLYFAVMSAHGTNYHNIHHIDAAIPWFRMRRATRLCVDESGVDTARGFADAMRQMIEAKP